MNRRELLDTLTRNTDQMQRRLVLPTSAMDRSYGPGKWNVRQLLAHLADCEFINLWRFCRAVAEPGSTVDAFSENGWAKELRYETRPQPASAELFSGARATLTHYADTLPEATLDHACRHPEKGLMSGWDWIDLAIGHTTHHMSQIDAAVAGEPWVKPEIENAGRFGA
jgi:uncharacterized damage-inducible protein DinB